MKSNEFWTERTRDIYQEKFYIAEIINDMTAVVNAGSILGISKGMYCVVFGEGQEIFDPKTKESLGFLELLRGKAIVTQVQDRFCVIRSYKQKVSSPFGALTAQFVERYEDDNLKFVGFDDAVSVGDIVKFLR